MKFKDYENAEEIKKDISLAGDKICYRVIQIFVYNLFILISLAFAYFIVKRFLNIDSYFLFKYVSLIYSFLGIVYSLIAIVILLNCVSSYIYLIIKLKRWKKQSH